MSLTAVRGMHDLYGPEIHQWRAVEKKIEALFQAFGFEEIRTPLLEKLEVFSETVGEQSDIVQKQMYRFQPSPDETFVLRPEGTAAFMRAVIERQLHRLPQKKKYFYYGPMFRHERPQKGRQRQFFQFGGEIINEGSPIADAELIAFLCQLYSDFKIQNKIEINSVGCQDCRPTYRKKLMAYLEPFRNALCATCQERMDRAPMRVLDCKNPECQKIAERAPVPLGSLCEKCSNHHTGLKDTLKILKVPFEENPRIVRGLDYYVRTAFEFTSTDLGAQSALCGGGRYDNLSTRFTKEVIPAVGFGLGMERLMIALEATKVFDVKPTFPVFYFVALGEKAFEQLAPLCFNLRQMGTWSEITYDHAQSLKSQLKHADRSEAHYAVILGEDELKAGKALIKDMKGGTQQEVALPDLLSQLRGRIKS